MEMKALDPLDDISFELQGDDSQTARVLAPTDGEEGIQRGRLIQPSRFRVGVMQGKRPPPPIRPVVARTVQHVTRKKDRTTRLQRHSLFTS